MSQMRLNQLTGRWVTIVADRAQRPTDFAPPTQADILSDTECPFCPGAKDPEKPVLERTDANGNWTIRVVPNRYPAFAGDDGFAVHNLGPVHVAADGTGIHEVFVFTNDHATALDSLSDELAGELMLALRDRFADHGAMPNIRYTQAIVNHGREAGASLSHPHGQLLGLPFVPGEVLDEERAFARFAGGCLLCTTVEAETSEGSRVVFANDAVVVLAPYWSGTPYELLIVPRQHKMHLKDADGEVLSAVGRALRDATAALTNALGDVSYNVGLHTAPHAHDGEYHWHLHIWPNLVTQAGFERGTGVLINVMPPETAAATLRDAAAAPTG